MVLLVVCFEFFTTSVIFLSRRTCFFVPLEPLLLLSVVAFLRNFLRLVWACNFWPDAYVVYFLEPGPISALEPGLQLGVGVLAVDASSIHLDTLDRSVLQERTLVFDILATATF